MWPGPRLSSNAVIPPQQGGGCLDSFSPLLSGLVRFGWTRFGSAVLQLQTGDPLVPAAALLAEAADVLQGLTLQRLHRRVLQNTAGREVRLPETRRCFGCRVLQLQLRHALSFSTLHLVQQRGGGLTVTRMQCRSRGSFPLLSSVSSSSS